MRSHEGDGGRHPEGFVGDTRQGCNLLLWLALVWAAPAELFLRKFRTAGCRHWFDVRFLFGFAFIWLFGAAAVKPPEGIEPFFYAPYLCSAVWAAQVLGCVTPGAPGLGEHSRYVGDSVVAAGGRRDARHREPLAVAAAAVCGLASGPALFAYLVGAAACHAVVLGWMGAAERSRRRDVADARIRAEQDARYAGDSTRGGFW